MVNKFRAKQQLRAWFLLVVLCLDTLSPYASMASNSKGSAGPVAASANNMVDPFTGNFNYAVPLLTVPGPNGESVDVSASYQGGIRAEQQASWLGLGWGYEPGEISRNISGVPDDLHNKYTYEYRNSKEYYNYVQGPLYFSELNTPFDYNMVPNIPAENRLKCQDISVQYKKLKEPPTYSSEVILPFKFPNYDNYSVSGPGIGGKIKPYLMSGELTTVNRFDMGFPLKFPISNTTAIPIQFYYEGSTAYQGTDANWVGFDKTTNRINSGTFIKYYTNNQINNNTNLYDNSKHIGFLDFQVPSSTRRPAASFDPNGIGGFEITTPGGLTYHYSLPVYTSEERSFNFWYTDLYTPNPYDNGVDFNFAIKNYLQATSWKLTAVTGADYTDVNDNKMVDEGDKGYWISYHYTNWCNDYAWSVPFYNFKTNLALSNIIHARGIYNLNPLARSYAPKGNTIRGLSQDVYLDYIKTASHTAFFVKEIRLDEHGYEHVLNSSDLPTPKLKLKSIVLLKNEDAGLFNNLGTFPVDGRFNTNKCAINVKDFIHSGKLNPAIENKALKVIDFKFDYSLCKNIYNNINNTVSNLTEYTYKNSTINSAKISQFICSVFVPGTSTLTSSDANNSGKLTLQEIISYENAKTKVFPSYKFAYSKNPNYKAMAADVWGYYKSDFNPSKPGYFTTEVSKNDVDAWSLTDITTPLGGTVKVNYESDEYVLEGGGGKPSFIYPVINIKNGPVSADVEFNNADYTTPGAFSTLIIPKVAHCSKDLPGLNSNVHYKGTANANGLYGGLPMADNAMDLTCTGNIFITGSNYSPSYNGYAYVVQPVDKAYGGGIRVKDIVIGDPESGENYKQTFEYINGICSVLPGKFAIDKYDLVDNQDLYEPDGPSPNVGYSTVNIKSISNNGQNNGRISYSFNNNPAISYVFGEYNHSDYNLTNGAYYNLDGSAFSFTSSSTSCNISKNYGNSYKYGRPHQISTYDAADVLVTYKKFTYENTNGISETFSSPSTEPEIDFPTYRTNAFQNYGNHYDALESKWVISGYNPALFKVPHNYYVRCTRTRGTCMLKETETYANGISSKSTVLSRDPLTGNPIEAINIDPSVGATKSTTTYAYTQNAYSNVFGPKTKNEASLNNLNAVSQSISVRYPQFHSSNGALQINNLQSNGILLGGSKVVYSNQLPIYKYNPGSYKYETNLTSSYLWLPTETYELLTEASTPGNLPEANYNWRKTNTVKKYLENYTPIESENASGRLSATKLGYNNLFPISAVADATYSSFTFTSFEDYTTVNTANGTKHFGGEVSGGEYQMAATTSQPAHTGNYLAKVPANTFGPTYFANNFSLGRTYCARVWVHKNSPDKAALYASLDGSINGTPTYKVMSVFKNDPANIVVGDWILMRLNIEVPAAYTAVGGSQNDLRVYVYNTGASDAFYDDFKVSPVDAPVGGNVYDPRTGLLMATLDADNFATIFEYDAAGRVIRSWTETDKGLKKVSENTYHFARP